MNEYFCFNCDHRWHDLDADHCPGCGDADCIVNEGEVEWIDGHFEGGFPSSNHDNSVTE